jgi:glycosyltransferase involved in cell wall biosynthesis
MLVSVIIPTYNRVSFLLESVKCVLQQSYTDFEIVIVSDGSTDNSKEEIAKLKDSRIKFIELDKNYGYPARARNEGVKLSNGEFIAFCDDDDLWERNKLERQMEMVDRGYNFIFTNYKFLDGSKTITKKNYLEYMVTFIINRINTKLSYLFLGLTNPIVNSSVLVSKHLIANVKFAESVLYRASEDYQCWIQIYSAAKPFYLKKELVTYRVHENNISSDFGKNLKRCVLVMKDFEPKNVLQLIFKKIAVLNYSFRVFINY